MKNKFKTPIWVNFSLLVLLLISSSFTLTACQNMRLGPEAIKKEKEAKKAAQTKQNENKPTKSKAKQSNPTPGKEQDTQIDDDPE
ncbi:MAG: hypothetical protein ABI417_07825 [Coleofasciculaceae cyanobacterium]